MPIGIDNITNYFMGNFTNTADCQASADAYFKYIRGKPRMKRVRMDPKDSRSKYILTEVYDKPVEPATITGLALWMGFSSLEEFEAAEHKGRFAAIIRRARLMVEAEYEKKLHTPPANGAIFVLKSLGWTEKSDGLTRADIPSKITIQVTQTHPLPAGSEKEVDL